MTSFNYVMVCDLQGADGIMTNKEIDELNDKFEGVTEKIEEYDEEENTRIPKLPYRFTRTMPPFRAIGKNTPTTLRRLTAKRFTQTRAIIITPYWAK